MRRQSVAPLAGILCAAASIGLAGCAPAAAPAGLPENVAVEVLQGRTDYTGGTLVIRIVNGSDEDLDLNRASLASPGFDQPALWDRGTAVRAGSTVDLRATVPEQACDVAPGKPQVTLTLGSGSTVSVAATDPLGTLERLHASGCIVEQVDRIAEVSVSMPAVEGAGSASVAVLPLSVVPTGADGSVTFATIGSTPLLRPAPGVSDELEVWPLSITLTPASESVSVPVRIVPARCDPHAIAEDKIGTVLVLAVTLDDGTTGDYRLTPSADVREALLDFVREHCGMA